MHEELFEALRRDHEMVRSTIHRLQGEGDAEARVKLVFELETFLLPHLLAEERVIYPRLREDSQEQIRADALAGIAEHDAVRMVLRDLAETPAGTESFPAKVRVLLRMVDRHIEGEESDLFRDLRETVDRKEAGELLERFVRARENPPCAPAAKGWWGGY